MLIEQQYLGIDDYTTHFYAVLQAFKDQRYIKVDDKPLFLIYKPLDNPEVITFIKVWRKLAVQNGLSGIHFVGHNSDVRDSVESIFHVGVDAVNTLRMRSYMYNGRTKLRKVWDHFYHNMVDRPIIYSYAKAARYFFDNQFDVFENIYPSIISGWDHTPRSGSHGLVLNHFTPDLFREHVAEVLQGVMSKSNEHRIVFLKSWNEWAEGNYVEPDLKYGTSFLKVLKDNILG